MISVHVEQVIGREVVFMTPSTDHRTLKLYAVDRR
jgi:hypothetical protein